MKCFWSNLKGIEARLAETADKRIERAEKEREIAITKLKQPRGGGRKH